MRLCCACLALGYCARLSCRIVSDDELANPEFIRDVKMTAYDLRVSCDEWLEYLTRLYRDYRGRIVDQAGREILLDMEEFERPNIRYWFRDFCGRPCPTHVTPRLRREARERVRILATLLRAVFPDKAQFWGVRPANDNDPTFKKGTRKE